ncbi:MAG TPA: TetR/AcrR family transcriptional regulator [Vicinamibacterales bacterium]|nr:TetR/AcrR family transcriptional regulator [Vicinamibacterales bacterium]
MRYTADHKQHTRERIVRAAARRFRARGSTGAAIAGMMRELRLTHGGFYRHFPSKHALFTEALSSALDEVADRMDAAADSAPAGRAFEALVNTYLSTEHCAHPEAGCPVAALGPEIARLPKAQRASARQSIARYIKRVARHVPGATPLARERRAEVLFSAMAGTLSAARAEADETAREQLLLEARKFFATAGRA